MVPLMFTRNASFFSGTTSVTVLVVGQNMRLQRLRFNVRVPGRTGPSAFITRHCGLHWGIRFRSLINAHTVATGALMSTCACSTGATIALSFRVKLFSNSLQPALRAARPAAHRATLPHENGGAKQPDPQS